MPFLSCVQPIRQHCVVIFEVTLPTLTTTEILISQIVCHFEGL